MSGITGILVFDGVDELDFVGPLNVFSYSAGVLGKANAVVTIARENGVIAGGNGLSFYPTFDFGSAPKIDTLIVPGGRGTDKLVTDQDTLTWIRDQSNVTDWVGSVCSGAFVLQAAGLTNGRRITTHSKLIDHLRGVHSGEVVEGQRFVVDGNLITSAGVTAGIDMALWIVGKLHGADHAKTVRENLEYAPASPP